MVEEVTNPKHLQIIELLKAGKKISDIATEVGVNNALVYRINKEQGGIIAVRLLTSRISAKKLREAIIEGKSDAELLLMGYKQSYIYATRANISNRPGGLNLDRPSSEQPLVKLKPGIGKYHETAARINKKSEPIEQTQWEYKIGENVTLKVDARSMDNVILDMKRGKVTIHVTNL